MPSNTKFTIVIPTRERADVLSASLRTAVVQNYDNLEIIVSDNFSNDGTEEIVRSFNDPRIRYLNTGKRLSMSHNWEFALSHISEGWVTILGDDDGMLPGALIRAREIIDAYKVDAIRSDIGSYVWPSLSQTSFGKLSVNLRQGCELRNSKQWLSRLVNGRESYIALPTLYTGGFINYQLIKRAQNAAGKFYSSMVPDVYSAVALSRITENYVFSHDSLAIGGASRHSTGSSQFSKNKSPANAQTPANKYYSEVNIPFHSDLPLLPDGTLPPSIQVLVYESFLQSQHLASAMTTSTAPEQQLEIIIRNAKRHHRGVLSEWAKMFSQQHGLDLASVQNKSRKVKIPQKLEKNIKKIFNQFNSINISGSHNLPIVDVYEASIVASTIKAIRPNKLISALRRCAGS
jgi:glycosyltransferase involved in cell wall biosynthesis